MRNAVFGLFIAVALIVSADLLVTRPDVRAQSAPAGSCLLADGSWCWPTQPTSYGTRCFCPDGRSGIGQ